MIKQTRVENGLVRGIPAADPRIISYKGIPFAAPPVGELRWRAPQPAKDWDGVLDCSRFAPISMQQVPGSQHNIYEREWNVDPEIPMDEDCLYLNVWTPAKTAEERLPVFVWYFGGGLQEGNPAEMEFNGERIARRGVVVVTINYRLNVFGFLCHPEITAEDPDAPANFGHLDQMAATEWVKRNIANFGGDPENITIGGQSAGGGSVVTMLTTPRTEGLFQKAVILSGSFYGGYGGAFDSRRRALLKDAEQAGVKFFEYLGVGSLAEARALDAFYLRDKFREYISGSDSGDLAQRAKVRPMIGPCMDEKFSWNTGMTSLVHGQRHMVPLLMGNTVDEFPGVPPFGSTEELEAYAEETFGDEAGKFMELVRGETWEETKAKATYSFIELGCRCVLRNSAEQGAPDSYYYQFNPFIPGEDNPGSFHSSDLWFWFESLAACWRPFTGEHYDVARQMCNYLANFIKTGNPNGDDVPGRPLPEWKTYGESRAPMFFGRTSEMKDASSEPELMKFLEDFYRER